MLLGARETMRAGGRRTVTWRPASSVSVTGKTAATAVPPLAVSGPAGARPPREAPPQATPSSNTRAAKGAASDLLGARVAIKGREAIKGRGV